MFVSTNVCKERMIYDTKPRGYDWCEMYQFYCWYNHTWKFMVF